MPTKMNLTQLDCSPGTGGENPHHMGDMNMPMMESAEVSRWKESPKRPMMDSCWLEVEKPNSHLGGVKATTDIELTRK